MRWAIICVMLLVAPVAAQNLGGFARVDPAQSQAKDGFFGKTHVTLSLSQGVPYRLFHLTDPNRFVIDFQQVDFAGLLPDNHQTCLLYTSPSPRDGLLSRMPSSA